MDWLLSTPDEDATRVRTKETSKRGLELLSSVENKETKVMIERSICSVSVVDGGKALTVRTHFYPISTKDLVKTSYFPWEESLCALTGLSFTGTLSSLPFQKDRMKYYTKYLGISPLRWVKIYNAHMCKAFIPEELSSYARRVLRGNRGHYDKVAIGYLTKNKQVILQCIEDGMENVTPFFLFLEGFWTEEDEQTVANFRKKVGKGLWKRLLKNSLTRNKALCLSYSAEGTKFPRNKRGLKELQEVPSGLLSRTRTLEVMSVEAANIIKGMKLITKTSYHNTIEHIVTDTKSMCSQLGKDLPKQHIKWTLDKWKERHEFYTEQLHLKNYSKDTFKWLENITKEYTSECGDFKAVLLDNAFDINNEGTVMKHCVGSYSGQVRNGKYLVLSIQDLASGLRQSTLGLMVQDNTVLFNQHYKHCNASVKDEKEKAFAKYLTKELNQQLKGDK